MFAVIVFVYLTVLSWRLLRTPGLRGWAVVLASATLAQAMLGILNVKLALPLPIAVMHNGGAAVLLFVLATLMARLRRPD
jgi:cytochrome c oxidase assembly protein subunit 15